MLACSLWLPKDHSLAGLAPAGDLPQTTACEKRDNLNSHHLSDFFCIKCHVLSFTILFSVQYSTFSSYDKLSDAVSILVNQLPLKCNLT